jgi:ubiquitin carboxyl-terminal hydrolase 36/42
MCDEFRFAIDLMQMICLDTAGGEKAVDVSIQETSLIYRIFGGCLQSQVKCMQCLHESNRYEPMMDLAVEIQGNVKSLEDALGQFTSTELLDGVNKYECDQYVLLVLLWKFILVIFLNLSLYTLITLQLEFMFML